MSFCADHDEGAGRFPCGPGYIGEGEISDQAGAGQGSGVSPLPHHAPQATPAKFIGVRSCARYEIGRRDAGQGLQDQQHAGRSACRHARRRESNLARESFNTRSVVNSFADRNGI